MLADALSSHVQYPSFCHSPSHAHRVVCVVTFPYLWPPLCVLFHLCLRRLCGCANVYAIGVRAATAAPVPYTRTRTDTTPFQAHHSFSPPLPSPFFFQRSSRTVFSVVRVPSHYQLVWCISVPLSSSASFFLAFRVGVAGEE